MTTTESTERPLPKRKPQRLPCYDYAAPGLYFVTVCTHRRRCLFGTVADDGMFANNLGRTIETHWHNLPHVFFGIRLDAFTLMPNHIHGLLAIERKTGHRLSDVLRTFKSFSAREINKLRQTSGAPLWQRGFYEHIVRNEADLKRIRSYIVSNPTKWQYDRENPANLGALPIGGPVLDRPLRKHSDAHHPVRRSGSKARPPEHPGS